MIKRDDCLLLDDKDKLREYRQRFVLPPGKIYLDGNSLGAMPKGVQQRVVDAMEVGWGIDLITSWNKHNWFSMARSTGDKVGRLIGAGEGNTMIADTISVNLFKALTSALAMRRDRKIVLSDSGNFPSDLYVAQGLNTFLQDGHVLRVVAPEDIAAAISDEVAVVMLTEVDYRTARRHDMKAITKLAHEKGCLVIWDLAHSAGALCVDLMGADADFAVGCTYKYLNGGPGSQAFIWVHPRNQKQAEPALVGWWGHKEPFSFDLEWKPAEGMLRQQCGTQAILSLVALDAAMDVWAEIDMADVEQKAHGLAQAFIECVEASCGPFGLSLAGPRDMRSRGSHVSFSCPNGYAVMQALISNGVIGDFRAPDLIRFGFAPLYNGYSDVFDAAEILAKIMRERFWDQPEFLARKTVT